MESGPITCFKQRTKIPLTSSKAHQIIMVNTKKKKNTSKKYIKKKTSKNTSKSTTENENYPELP